MPKMPPLEPVLLIIRLCCLFRCCVGTAVPVVSALLHVTQSDYLLRISWYGVGGADPGGVQEATVQRAWMGWNQTSQH